MGCLERTPLFSATVLEQRNRTMGGASCSTRKRYCYQSNPAFPLVGDAVNPSTMAPLMFDRKYTSWLLFWE